MSQPATEPGSPSLLTVNDIERVFDVSARMITGASDGLALR